MGRIVMYKGLSSYNVLRYFIDELEAAFKQLGKDVVVVDLVDNNSLNSLKAALSEPCEFLFSCNAIGIEMVVDNKSLYDVINAPFFAFMVDHPLYHLGRLDCNIENLIITCVDRHHLNFISNHYQHNKTCAFLPQAGSAPLEKTSPSFSERDIAIYFPGSFSNATEIRKQWKDYFGFFSNIMDDIVEVSLTNENTSLEESINIVLRTRGIYLHRKLHTSFLKLVPQANNYIRAYRREECVKVLSDAGLEVFVLGETWRLAPFGDKLRIGNQLDMSEMISLMGQAKIVLNVNPNLQDGCCERVFYAMLNGAVCLTDKTGYLAEEFTDGEDLIFFTRKNIHDLPDKIYGILDSPGKWAAVAWAGQRKARERHTWLVRAQRILELVNYFKVLRAVE